MHTSMANKKNKVNFLCSACGDDFPKWHGQCPSCKEWGTLSEFKVLGNKNIKRSKLDYRDYKPLNDILDSDPGERITTNITEADRVLGCLLYTSPSPRDLSTSRMPSSA